MKHMFADPDRAMALADANNFFASCERKVDPSLEGRPVVVLSCNDGCVIARSNEVKRMGIKMGEPYFKIKNTLAYYNVAVRSTNMPLYQEVSAAVMARIRIFTDALEQYSIDEGFFNLGIANIADPVAYCRTIKDDIWRHCHIPVSIGISPTKTLSKLAAEYAKKHPDTDGVYWINRNKYSSMEYMSQYACSDIWGIGRKTSDRLAMAGINTASDFIRMDELRVKKEFSVRGLFTLWELKGRPAYPLETERNIQKSIMVSRSFGSSVSTLDGLIDPLWCFTASAARQLRRSGLAAGRIGVFIMTGWFVPEDRRYYSSRERMFRQPAFLDRDLMSTASALLRQIFVQGYEYKKCGVYLSELTNVSSGMQSSLFGNLANSKAERLAQAVDKLNTEFGRSVIKPAALFAAPGKERVWQPKAEFKSSTGIGAPLDGIRFQSHADDYIY